MNMKKVFAVTIIIITIGMSVNLSSAVENFGKSSIRLLNVNTLYVGGSGFGNYSTIQDAIDNASDGDTIFVYDDSSPYFENLIFNKQISLIGENRETTIIDGNDRDNVILITENNVNISNFNIQNCKETWGYAGIKIQSDFNEISNNYFQYNYRNDIIVDKSSFNKIENNLINSNSYYGIELESESNNNYILGNFIQNHSTGIMIWGNSNYTTVSKNIIDKGTFGVGVYGHFSTISNNIISDICEGINLHDSRYNIIENNEFLCCGIILDSSKFNVVKNNIVNGKPLLYLENKSYQKINFNTGQIIIINCEFVNIEDQDISDTTIGIIIKHTNNVQIKNCNTSSNNKDGLMISGSNNITISNSKFILNRECGISISGSNIEIVENTINYNYNGIDISSKNILVEYNNISYNRGKGLGIYSSSVTIFNNNISNNGDGIFMMNNGNKNIFSNNIFYSNSGYAINFDFYQSNNLISNNIFKNNYRGIHINGKNNTVSNNHFEGNVLGIYASSSDEFLIINNNFINNDKQVYFYYYGFERTKTNKWIDNYWQKPRIFPYIIFGRVVIRIQFDYKTIPWFQIDWHPAKEPY